MSTGLFNTGKISLKLDTYPQLRFSHYFFEILLYSVLQILHRRRKYLLKSLKHSLTP